MRVRYTPAAKRGAILFFVMASLANITNMYEYSLGSFLRVFNQSLDSSKKDASLKARLKNIIDRNTLDVYSYTCLGNCNAMIWGPIVKLKKTKKRNFEMNVSLKFCGYGIFSNQTSWRLQIFTIMWTFKTHSNFLFVRHLHLHLTSSGEVFSYWQKSIYLLPSVSGNYNRSTLFTCNHPGPDGHNSLWNGRLSQ